MISTVRSACCAVSLLALSLPAVAHHVGEMWQAGDLIVSHGWTYENATMEHAVNVYVTVENQGDEPDRLISAAVDFADRTGFQAQVLGADGTLEIRNIPAIQINAGQVLTLQPGAVWVELESVHRTFEHGEHFDMTLTFENAGSIEIEVEIEEEDGHDLDPNA
ncbi:MAG: copper chaperone PCu(A)C [Pseudomonadota bacterium]